MENKISIEEEKKWHVIDAIPEDGGSDEEDIKEMLEAEQFEDEFKDITEKLDVILVLEALGDRLDFQKDSDAV